jgi:hypothetical protein
MIQLRELSWLLTGGSALLAALGVSGCGVEVGDDGRTTSTEEPLWKTGAAWPGGTVPVCWDSASVARSDFALVSRRVRHLADSSFPVVANVEFTGWGTCGASVGGKLKIVLTDSGGSFSGVGYPGSSGPNVMTLDVSRGLTYDVPHEFAHALGFDHEFDRPDWSAPPTRPDCVASPPVSGDGVNTASDFDSITVTTYCETRARPWELSLWDAVGAQTVYGPRLNQVRPLVTAWNGSRQDNATVSTSQGVADLNNGGYAWAFAHGWVFNSQLPGTVPLNLYWNTSRQDNITVSTTTGKNDAIAAGYAFIRTEGYVFSSSQGSFTVPLKLYWHPTRLDNLLTTPGFSEDQAIAAGYSFLRVEGYIPNQTPYALIWSYWSDARLDNLATKQNTEESIDAVTAGYVFNGFDGAVWRFPFQGTTAVKQYWSPARADNFLLASAAGEQTAISSGYSFVSREDILGEPDDAAYTGYVYTSSQPGTSPLKSYWNGTRNDNFTTISKGSLATSSGYSLVRTEGWGLGIND